MKAIQWTDEMIIRAAAELTVNAFAVDPESAPKVLLECAESLVKAIETADSRSHVREQRPGRG